MSKSTYVKLMHQPAFGAFWMIVAGLAFAIINTIIRYVNFKFGIPPESIAFWQYFLALLLIIPNIIKNGAINFLRTKYWKSHILRVVFAVVGIQFWTAGLAMDIPLAQAITLLMMSPLFATVGSAVFLKEKVSKGRILATVMGFLGGIIILEPWSNHFTWSLFLPLGAAFFWASYSLMIKKQSYHESPSTLVIYLLAIMLPFNVLIALPTWVLPLDMSAWLFILIIGSLTTIAQWAIAKAYSVADASFVQPFDHVKLPLNILLGWLVFSESPRYLFWIGASIIVISVSLVTRYEHRRK